MFGIIRPCRNRLGPELRRDWLAHLCGLCLALRDEHGQAARMVTNYDAIVVSALVEAQLGRSGMRRTAGPCALRSLRRASVAEGDGARLAAAVSLLLASAKLHDHVADGDVRGRLRARATSRVAAHLAGAGVTTGVTVALDSRALLDTVATQAGVERAPGSLLEVTAPTEAATALAFRHTAVVAGRPGNEAPLAEAGRLFGRLAHLLDAVEDLHDDRAAGRWNPVDALGLSPDEVRRYCDDAVLGVRLALREADFVDERLVHRLLAHELDAAVVRTFTRAGQPPPGPPPGPPPLTPPLPPAQQPPGRPGWEAPPPEQKKGPIAGCLATLVACGTCEACSRSDGAHGEDEERRSWCDRLCDSCDCCSSCGDCNCDCCDCCDCCSCDC